jgi:hypothetical protein
VRVLREQLLPFWQSSSASSFFIPPFRQFVQIRLLGLIECYTASAAARDIKHNPYECKNYKYKNTALFFFPVPANCYHPCLKSVRAVLQLLKATFRLQCKGLDNDNGISVVQLQQRIGQLLKYGFSFSALMPSPLTSAYSDAEWEQCRK